MRLTLDSFVLRFPRTGIVTYVLNLLYELATTPNIDLTLLLEDENFSDASIKEYVESRFRLRLVEQLTDVDKRLINAPQKLEARLPMPREVSRAIEPEAIYHATDWYHYPGRYARANVLTYFDLTAILFPQFHEYTNITKEKRKLEAAKTFDHIIAISKSTRDDLIEHGDIDPEKVSISYLGADKIYDRDTYLSREEMLGFLNLDPSRPYLLSVNTIEPRKNTIGILNSYKVLCQTNKSYADVYLVLSGPSGWRNDELRSYLASYPYRDNIVFAGYVPLQKMPSLYRHAEAFIYLSFYEGFGIPILEAMKCKCPVVCSNTSSMPEVLGDAGEMVSPHSADECAAALIRVLESPVHADMLRHAGFQRSREFSWRRHADEVMQIYSSF